MIAKDQTSNPEGRGLSYEKDTEAFDVDNEPPTITATVSGGLVKVVVSDAINAIRKAEWAKEAGTWTDPPSSKDQSQTCRRQSIADLIALFADFLSPLPTEPAADAIAALSKLIDTVSTQGVAGGLNAQIGHTLASSFYEFVAERSGSVKALIVRK